jgi:hypothetical protein
MAGVSDFLILFCHIDLFEQTFSISLRNGRCLDNTFEEKKLVSL